MIYGQLTAPFSPDVYMNAVTQMEKAGATVIIIDSMSHEWAGEGGCLEMQECELDETVKRAQSRNDSRSEWQIREAARMTAWIKPKMAHKKMMGRFLQCNAHLIFCLRAEEKVKPQKNAQGKIEIVPLGWMPICEKNLMYEMTCSFILSDTTNHLPTPIKLQDQHRTMFPLDRPISEQCGDALAKWARGGVDSGGAGAIGQPSKSPDGGVQLATPPDDSQGIYDEIVAFARATSDPVALKEAWLGDQNVPVLKRTNAMLYDQALKIVNKRLKELRNP